MSERIAKWVKDHSGAKTMPQVEAVVSSLLTDARSRTDYQKKCALAGIYEEVMQHPVTPK